MLQRLVMRGLMVGLLSAGPVQRAWGVEHGEETNLFNADIGNFILTLLIFGLVMYVLGRYAWQPLLKVLQERERTVRESLETARRERQAAERLLSDYRAQLDLARQEASAIVDEGRRDAEAVRRRIQEEARQQAGEITERARREIRLATETAVKELYDQTAHLAVNLASRVIRKELSTEDQRRLLAEALDQMAAASPAKLRS